MSAVLDVLAPLKTVTKRGGRPSSRWLSEAAVDAKYVVAWSGVGTAMVVRLIV